MALAKKTFDNIETDNQYKVFMNAMKAIGIICEEEEGYPVVEGVESIAVANAIYEFISNNF